MHDFTFYNPVKVIMGRGVNSQIGQELCSAGISKVLLLYGGNSIKANGVYEEVVKSLEKCGIDYAETGGVKPNPVLSKVREAAGNAKDNMSEAVVAIGGGSVVDSAKAVAAGAVHGGDIWDFYTGAAAIKSALPIYGVITISATASEMNFTSVITNEEQNLKVGLHSPKFFLKCAAIDPSVQFSVPERQTVNGGIDAISHVLETYFDGASGVDIQKEYCEGLVRSFISLIPRLREKPDDYDARSQMAWGSICALNGTTWAGHPGRGDFASHAMGHPMSAQFDSVHGETLAVVMPAWMRYVCESHLDIFSRFAEKIFDISHGSDRKRSAMEGIDMLKRFFIEQGAPASLREMGIPEDSLHAMARTAARLGPIGSLKKLNFDDVLQIYRSAY